MKLFTIITILATSHLGNEISADDNFTTDVQCEPRKIFLDDQGCNTCTCARDGKSAGCTRRFCPEPKPVPLDKRPCTPGKTFRAGCQRCRCSKDGYVASCSGRPTPPGCVPGEIKKVDCNTCTCTPERVFRCTELFCPQTTTVIPIENPWECIPGIPVIIDCNSCNCNPDGTIGFRCTDRACPD